MLHHVIWQCPWHYTSTQRHVTFSLQLTVLKVTNKTVKKNNFTHWCYPHQVILSTLKSNFRKITLKLRIKSRTAAKL